MIRNFHIRRTPAIAFLVIAAASCTPVSKSLEIHTDHLSCDEANRYVFGAVQDMDMQVTKFEAAKPGRPGLLKASGKRRSGSVTIRCEADGVHIDPKQSSGDAMAFERGIFLSVTGRGDLEVDRGKIVGRRATANSAGSPAPASAAGAAQQATAPPALVAEDSSSLTVVVEPQHGFATVLDFDADLSAAGILPLKITVRNGSERPYDFDPDDIQLRVRGSRARAEPLGNAEASARLQAAGSEASIGDTASAARIMAAGRLTGGRLDPGASQTGYLYFPTGEYDRAKVTMTDVRTGEIEGFMVEF